MKKALPIFALLASSVALIFSCTSADTLELPPLNNSSSSLTMVLCVYQDRCEESPYGTCPGGGQVSDFCPHTPTQSSSSSNSILPNYNFCIYHGESQCLPGPLTSCPGTGGSLSNTCPYPPYVQASSSSSASTSGTCPVIPNIGDGNIIFVDSRDEKAYKYEILPNGRVWMMENLNYSGFGTIGWCYGTGQTIGIEGADGAGCNNGYGRTYTWPSTNICPEGWAIPTRADWTSVLGYVTTPPSDFYIYAGNYNTNSSYPPLGWKERGSLGFYWTSEANNYFVFISSSSYEIQSVATGEDRFSIRCIASTTIMPKCNGVEYDLNTHFCDGTLYENTSCGGRLFNSKKQVCSGTTILTKCGDNESYNPATQFCTSCGVFAKYGNSTYEPSICGTGYYNSATHFCSSNEIYALCNGNPYNPLTHGCSGTAVYPLCNGTIYNPATYKCEGSAIVPI